MYRRSNSIANTSQLISHRFRMFMKPLKHMLVCFFLVWLAFNFYFLKGMLHMSDLRWIPDMIFGHIFYAIDQLKLGLIGGHERYDFPLIMWHGSTTDFEHIFWLRRIYVENITNFFHHEFLFATKVAAATPFCIYILYKLCGIRMNRKKIVDGRPLLSGWRLGLFRKKLRFAAWIRSIPTIRLGKGKASIKLPKNWLTRHLLLVGQSGSGKTTALVQLLDQLKAKGDRVVIIDKGCILLPRYFSEKKDILINPFDSRSESWHPWADAKTEADFAALATSMIPVKNQQSSNSIFFDTAARSLLKSMLIIMSREGNHSVAELRRRLSGMPASELEAMLENADMSAARMSGDMKGTRENILATLENHLEIFAALPDVAENKNVFSFKKWLHSDTDSWLFIGTNASNHDSVRALVSLQTDILLKEMLNLKPDTGEQIWFIIDELPSLNFLPSLLGGIEQIRKYGGSFVLGTQSYASLFSIYGQHGAAAILENISSALFFRCRSDTAKYASREFGKYSIQTSTSSSTISANDNRDSSSYHQNVRVEDVLSPSKVMDLPIGSAAFFSSGWTGKKYWRIRMCLKFPMFKKKEIAPAFLKSDSVDQPIRAIDAAKTEQILLETDAGLDAPTEVPTEKAEVSTEKIEASRETAEVSTEIAEEVVPNSVNAAPVIEIQSAWDAVPGEKNKIAQDAE